MAPQIQNIAEVSVLWLMTIFQLVLIKCFNNNSQDGRRVLANALIENDPVSLVCLYAPNDEKSCKLFFQRTKTWVEKHAENKTDIICSGDFNCCLKDWYDLETPWVMGHGWYGIKVIERIIMWDMVKDVVIKKPLNYRQILFPIGMYWKSDHTLPYKIHRVGHSRIKNGGEPVPLIRYLLIMKMHK